MSSVQKGLLLALLQICIVSSLGAKLLYDRAHRPRVWIKAAIYDPDLPIRGRYLALRLELPAEGFPQQQNYSTLGGGAFPVPWYRCNLALRNGQLTAVASQNGEFSADLRARDNSVIAIVDAQTAYFLPEHATGRLTPHIGEELWIEATIPRKGPPRPIRLGLKKDGVLQPLLRD